MNEFKTCPNCGEQNGLNNKFCTKCGTPLNNNMPNTNIINQQSRDVKYEIKGGNLPYVVLSLSNHH